MERSVVALTSSSVNEEAYSEIQIQLDSHEVSPKLIIFFSEVNMLWFFSQKLQKRYPDAVVIGSSTYVNFNSEGYSHSGASVIAINSDIEVAAGLIFDIDRHPGMYKAHITKALNQLSSCENTCCLEFMTAFGKSEELVLDTFEEILRGTNIKVAGSTAGSNIDEKTSAVALNGDIFVESCAFIFIHNLQGKIQLYRENLFRPTTHQLRITDVDCEQQRVYEFESKPAAEVLCNLLNVDKANLLKTLKINPIGRIEGENILISEAKEIMSDDSIVYYTRLYNMTRVVLLEIDHFDSVCQW